jgi:hypothetical protein
VLRRGFWEGEKVLFKLVFRHKEVYSRRYGRGKSGVVDRKTRTLSSLRSLSLVRSDIC